MIRSGSGPHFVRVYGLTLRSNIAVPEVPCCARRAVDLHFTLYPERGLLPGRFRWSHRWVLPGRTTWARFARLGREYLVRFAELADFLIAAHGRSIRCHAAPGVPRSTLRHLLLDQALPLALSARGELVLHASAVAFGGRALGFAGVAGRGKSTLAAGFMNLGCALLADDGLLLRRRGKRFLAWPSYPGLRLWPGTARELFRAGAAPRRVAHYTTKQRLGRSHDAFRFLPRPVPLARLYCLAPAPRRARPAVRIEPLAPRQAFAALLKLAYCLPPSDTGRLKREFLKLSGLAAQGLLRRISYSRRFEVLPAVQQAILRDVG
jgi:hypothetical protein